MSRNCGTCAECCTAMAIEALDKAAGERCPHDKGRGTRRCAIYGSPERPAECAAFSCGWREGALPSALRPDNSGLVVSYQDTRLGAALVIHESASGNVHAPKALRSVGTVMQRAASHGCVVFLMSPDGTRRLVTHEKNS